MESVMFSHKIYRSSRVLQERQVTQLEVQAYATLE